MLSSFRNELQNIHHNECREFILCNFILHLLSPIIWYRITIGGIYSKFICCIYYAVDLPILISFSSVYDNIRNPADRDVRIIKNTMCMHSH